MKNLHNVCVQHHALGFFQFLPTTISTLDLFIFNSLVILIFVVDSNEKAVVENSISALFIMVTS